MKFHGINPWELRETLHTNPNCAPPIILSLWRPASQPTKKNEKRKENSGKPHKRINFTVPATA